MNSDITQLKFHNVIDSCSVWNILLSPTIYQASMTAGCFFIMTEYVAYECLYKKRTSGFNLEYINKLEREISKQKFTTHSITIDDLQDIEILNNRKKLGKGELSAIVFAQKTRQAFLTDDKKARKLGIDVLGKENVQTTPHLVGYCFYKRYLLDTDYSTLINEHTSTLKGSWGNLSNFFKEVYEHSLQIHLMERKF
ncbi:hypothetical protein [Chryseobacterium sp. Mn2064]|uniref:hypothetical protein n=1 Tax=Chryseobacterium sp. Mn2064 TaxID=3395263 RepID=UPI003BC123C4